MATLTPRMDKIEAGQNLSINGNFDFWQRGTSITNRGAGDTNFLADRYKLTVSGTSAIYRMDRSTDVPTYAQSGFQSSYSLAIQCTTADAAVAAGDLVILRQMLEGYDYAQIASGAAFRKTFWVKSVKAGTYCLSLNNDANNRYQVREYTLTANTWTKVTFDLNSDTTGIWLLDNGGGLSFTWTLMAGTTFQGSANAWGAGNIRASSNQVNFSDSTSNIFYLAQDMTVAGSFSSTSDLPFKRAGKTIQQELAMCQRYFEKSFDESLGLTPGVNANGGVVSGYASATQIIGARYAVAKRAIPTSITIFGYSTGTSGAVSQFGAGNVLTSAVAAQSGVTGFGVVQGSGAMGAGTAYGYHFAAEAEL